MTATTPKLSIGLPVYNGENYLEEALDSLLRQTFEDFELIISDNGSNDRTLEISRDYAARDRRVKYFREEQNRGASFNYTRVFQKSRGKYFKWAAHDDICAPEYLARCIEALETDASVVLAHSISAPLYDDGTVGDPWPVFEELESSAPAERFDKVLRIGPEISFVWGIIRREALAKTSLLGNYVGHDRPLLTALSLMGRFRQVPELLFYQREHASRSVHASSWRNPHQAIAWYDTRMSGKLVFPAWRLLREHSRGIGSTSPDLNVRLACYRKIGAWCRDKQQLMVWDLLLAGNRIPILNKFEFRRLDHLFSEVWRAIPQQSTFILVDEEKLNTVIFSDWRVLPFLEKNGQYWGQPADDQTAIQELKRLRDSGAGFIVFIRDTHWWLEYYKAFGHHLWTKFPAVTNNSRCLIFDLRAAVA